MYKFVATDKGIVGKEVVYVVGYYEPYESCGCSSKAFSNLTLARSWRRYKNKKLGSDRRKYGCSYVIREVTVVA